MTRVKSTTSAGDCKSKNRSSRNQSPADSFVNEDLRLAESSERIKKKLIGRRRPQSGKVSSFISKPIINRVTP